MSVPGRLLTVDEAVAAILDRVRPLDPRLILLADALGLVLAEPIVADGDLPPFAKATMDGYAVRAADLAAGGEHRLRVVAEITAGQTSDRELVPGEAARIMTGAPLPPGADAVVQVERTVLDSDDRDMVIVQTNGPVPPGQFRLDRGREMRLGETLIEAGTAVRGGMIGLIGSAGRGSVRVIPRPTVTVVPTGDELVPIESPLPPGMIRNTNGPMLAALVRGWGATDVIAAPPAADRRDALAAAFERVVRDRDVLIVSGGVSAGILDLVPSVLVESGVAPVFHKVAVKPGKPIWFGVGPPRPGGRPGTLVFGLPGNPASGVVGFLLFVRPALEALAGRPSRPTPIEPATLGADFVHRGDRPTFHPARFEEGRVYPQPWAGSADLRTVALADGFAAFPAGDRPYRAGEAIGFLRLP